MFCVHILCNAVYKIIIVYIILCRFYYCSFIYPVADGVFSGTSIGRRGGTIEYYYRVLARLSRLFLLYLFERGFLVLVPVLTPLN